MTNKRFNEMLKEQRLLKKINPKGVLSDRRGRPCEFK